MVSDPSKPKKKMIFTNPLTTRVELIEDRLEKLTDDLEKQEKNVEKVNAYLVGMVALLLTTLVIVGLELSDIIIGNYTLTTSRRYS